jgi:hypothetical protein
VTNTHDRAFRFVSCPPVDNHDGKCFSHGNS